MAYLFVFLILLFADQITKAAAFAVYGSNGPLIYWIPNFLGLDTCYNPGASFGIAADKEWAMPLFIGLTVVAVVVLLIVFFRLSKKRRFLRTSIVLIMSGAIGNLIDRIVFQSVRDLIHMNFGFVSFSNNVADLVITVGAVMFILALLFVDEDAIFRSHKHKEKSEIIEAATELSSPQQETDNDLGAEPSAKNSAQTDSRRDG